MSESERSVFLTEMTWPEAREALAETEVAIIPVGSHEQHGPGMLLSTDITLATMMAGRVAKQLRPRAIVAPSLPVGLSSHHMRFPGSMTLTPETFTAVLKDFIISLQRHGMQRFFILNSHGGNRAFLSVFVTKMREELGVDIATAHSLSGAADLLIERFGRATAHACEIEASVALAAAPHLVRPEALAIGDLIPPSYRHTSVAGGGAMARGGSKNVAFIDYGQRMDEMTRNGNIGDPRLATREAGEEVVALIAQRMVEFLEDFIGTPEKATESD